MSRVGDINTGLYGPEPPGMNLSASRVPEMYGAMISTSVASTFIVALRFYSRYTFRIPMGKDDILIAIGLVVAWGTATCLFEAIPYGLGRHMYVLEQHQVARLWQNLYADILLYVFAVSSTKLSIVLFYKRIFASNLLAWPLVVLVCIYPVVIVIVMLTACKPLSYIWEQYSNPSAEGDCVELTKFYFGNGIWAASIDLVILLAPIPLTWRLQMEPRQKLAVLGVFALGGFVVVASVVRLVMLKEFMSADDPVWAIAPVYMWSSLEIFIGIICACLPTLSPLFKRFWSKRRDTTDPSTPRKATFSAFSSGKLGGKRRTADRLRPDDELILTTDTNVGSGTTRDGGDDEEDVHQLEHIHVRKDVDIDVR